VEHNSFGTKYDNCSNGTHCSFRTKNELNHINGIEHICLGTNYFICSTRKKLLQCAPLEQILISQNGT